MRWFGVCLLASSWLVAAEWPQWRGPRSAGVSDEAGLPTEWSPARNILWKTPLPGRGHSSPILWGDRIFLTTSLEGPAVPGAHAPKHIVEGQEFVHPDSTGADKQHTLAVLALDRVTGRVLWQRTAYEGRVYDDRHRKGSYASPTPVTDGQRVYAWFGSEGLYAYGFDGTLQWKTKLGDLGSVGMGPGASPALDGDLLFLQCDVEEGEGSFLAAVDKRTGRLAWKTPRNARATWSTPIVIDTGGRRQLIASASEAVVAYDPATGKELWRAKGVVGNGIPSPLAGHGLVFVSAGFPDKRAYGLKPAADGVTEVWSYQKGGAYVPSPILYGDYFYLMTDRGILTCLEAKTGKVVYPGGRVPKPATFTASPVAYDGKLFLTSEEGETFVIRAGPVHEVIGTNSVGEPVYASPAAANGTLYIRGLQHLYAIRAN